MTPIRHGHKGEAYPPSRAEKEAGSNPRLYCLGCLSGPYYISRPSVQGDSMISLSEDFRARPPG